VREGLQDGLLRNEPPPLLFIGPRTGARAPQTPPESTLGPITEHHVEGGDQPSQGRFGRTHSSADPLWARLPPSFGLLADMWVLGCILGGCKKWSRFGSRGPFNPCDIHVSSSDSSMVCFPWIYDLACMRGILGGSPSSAEVMWHGS
jgi:hypothetical protein